MSKPIKTATQKFETKIKNLLKKYKNIKHSKNKIKIRNKIFIEYNNTEIKYFKKRYYPSKVEDIVDVDFNVVIILSHENLSILSSNIINPPEGAKIIVDFFNKNTSNAIETIVLGTIDNKLHTNKIEITKELFYNILKINKEEGVDKGVRFKNRIIPFLKSSFDVNIEEFETPRDYSLLLREVIASGEYTQNDLLSLISKLEIGDNSKIIIEKQINKQVEWLIDTIQKIVDEPKISTPKAKELGSQYFNFAKSRIKGPEHLMEVILSEYGKHTLFGVPVLLNTDKYVIHDKGLPRCQFDIILINHLRDIQLVELKRADQIILDYDENRNKFFASKDLSIAISQAERYLSVVYRDNDEEYKIDGKKLRDFINSKIGGVMEVEICRPTALIIIGSYHKIAKPYDQLKENIKRKIKKEDYAKNYLQAYNELKNAFKNIALLSYSELIENARIRLL